MQTIKRREALFFASAGRTADAKRLNKNPFADFLWGLGVPRLGFDTASGNSPTSKQVAGIIKIANFDYARTLALLARLANTPKKPIFAGA